MHGFFSSPLSHTLVKVFLLQTLLCMNLRPVPSSLELVWFHCSVNSRNISHGNHVQELRGTESRGGCGERDILSLSLRTHEYQGTVNMLVIYYSL